MAWIETALFYIFLLYILQIQGSSAVTPVFVKSGEDLILNLTEAEIPPDSTIWSWQFTDKTMVTFINGSKPIVQKSHTERLRVLNEKYNVKLQNITKSDSGIYTAKLMVPKVKELTEYNVTVQDPVSPADLTLICKSRNSSFYILTVTCSAEDSSIISTLGCEGLTCNLDGRESRGVTKSGASLHIFRLNESIICNHSNHISWAKSVENIKDHCTQNGSRHHIWYIVLIIVVLLAAVAAFKKNHECKKGVKYNTENTIYALPAANIEVEKSNETAEDETCFPTTTYSTLGPIISKESTKPRGNEKPESLYGQIEKASR